MADLRGGKIIATFPARLALEYGVGRWPAFQAAVTPMFNLMAGVTVYWARDGEEWHVIAPGMTWEESNEATRQVIAAHRAAA